MNIVNRLVCKFRIPVLCFIILLLLAACGRRDQFRPDETDSSIGEQTTAAGQPDGSNPTETNPADINPNGGEVTAPNITTPPDIPIVTPPVNGGENGKITGNPYEGWTAEELYASFMEDRERSVYNETIAKGYCLGNTPYYVILGLRDGGYMFSKLTGQVVKICKDPICDHEMCIFNQGTTPMLLLCQVSDDRIYIAMYQNKENKTVMYSFDLLMNDPKRLGEIEDSPMDMYLFVNKVYYITTVPMVGGLYAKSVMVYDLDEKRVSPLWEDDIYRDNICFANEYVWYTLTASGSLHRYNLNTGEDVEILSGNLLNREEGETKFTFSAFQGEYVYYRKFLATGYSSNMIQYNMNTGETKDLGFGAVRIYGNQFFRIVSRLSEEYKDDPHYEYYRDSDGWGGKIFKMDGETGELMQIVALSTDGIPDQFSTWLHMDGKYVIVLYQTYKDFHNCYSPSNPEWACSERYVVVNTETGQTYELGVDISTQSVHNRNNQ